MPLRKEPLQTPSDFGPVVTGCFLLRSWASLLPRLLRLQASSSDLRIVSASLSRGTCDYPATSQNHYTKISLLCFTLDYYLLGQHLTRQSTVFHLKVRLAYIDYHMALF